jgi:hypothetical protein
VDVPAEAPALEPPATRVASRLGLAVAAAVAVLALVETGVALIAPVLAPTEADWAAAAREVRAGFKPGDLIVAAPAWSDPIVRSHLGDLVPVPVATRFDDARFGRVWEVSQRGARATEATRGDVALERRFGALTVRRVDRPAATVTYDFQDRFADARVSRRMPGQPDVVCPWEADRFQCPNIGHNFVRLQTVEVAQKLHRAMLAQPVAGGEVVIEFPAVSLGKELVVGTGLHDTWARKAANGPVDLRVVVAGTPQAAVRTTNEGGWLVTRIDTAAHAGRTVAVQFIVSSTMPYQRQFSLAAEARSP